MWVFERTTLYVYVCVCVCVCARARVCVREKRSACVRHGETKNARETASVTNAETIRDERLDKRELT